METTITDEFGEYQGREPSEKKPLLVVTAIDVEAGESKAFDSATHAVSVEHVMASCALPPWFPKRQINGRSYWDGGLWSNTPPRDTIKALRQQNMLSTIKRQSFIDLNLIKTSGFKIYSTALALLSRLFPLEGVQKALKISKFLLVKMTARRFLNQSFSSSLRMIRTLPSSLND